MLKKVNLFLVVVLALAFAGCKESRFKEDKVFAGGVYASKESLNHGLSIYTEYCMACHGVTGEAHNLALPNACTY